MHYDEKIAQERVAGSKRDYEFDLIVNEKLLDYNTYMYMYFEINNSTSVCFDTNNLHGFWL